MCVSSLLRKDRTIIWNECCSSTSAFLPLRCGYGPKGGAAQGAIQIQRDAWVLLEGERIFQVGTGTPPDIDAERIDAEGGLVTPGLVDAHTHLIFGGWRQNELGMNSMVSPISISLPKAAVSFLPSKAHGRPAKRS